MSTKEKQILALLYPERNFWRPAVRADCANVTRPCPYTSCKFNNYLDVAYSGSVVLNFPDIEPWEMNPDHSCTLDRAEEPNTLEEVGEILNLTRERIRQIQAIALAKLVGLEIAER